MTIPRNRLVGAGTPGTTLSGEAETLAGSLPGSGGGGLGKGGGFGSRRGTRKSGARAALAGGTGLSGLTGGSFNVPPISINLGG